MTAEQHPNLEARAVFGDQLLFTTTEVARVLHLSRTTVYTLINDGPTANALVPDERRDRSEAGASRSPRRGIGERHHQATPPATRQAIHR